MIELGQLEKRHEEFARRNTRIIAVSMDDVDESKKTQAELPHLVVLSDAVQGLAKSAQLVHKGYGHDGGDTNMPTTILVDRQGIVRWVSRPDSIMSRLSADDLLKAIDQYVVTK